MTDPTNQTYVYEQTEVKKTGRTAIRDLKSGRKEVKYEITPVDSVIGMWKKWVDDRDLLIVEVGEKKNENDLP